MNNEEILKKEAEAFDEQVDERIKHGLVPDLRRLRKVNWFYNNVWRDPKFVEIHLMPDVNFIINIAKQGGPRVIELGCGYGYLSLELARYGLDVTGVDISPRSIAFANKFAKQNRFKKNFGSLTYLCADIISMDLGEDQFDSVIFYGTLHHLADLDLILAKVSKALKMNGNLIICEPLRNNFTRKSAEYAAILRAVLPTWIPYQQKLKNLTTSESWSSYVEEIYKEYTYQDEHTQSPCDNATSSEDIMLSEIGKYFSIKTTEYSDAIIDRLIGGLRGKDKYVLAKFLKFLDDELISKKTLPPTVIRIHGIKQQE